MIQPEGKLAWIERLIYEDANLLPLPYLSATLHDVELATLAQAYVYAQNCLEEGASLDTADRYFLARLTLMAGAARQRRGKRLDSCVDAHVLAAEVYGFFLSLKCLQRRAAADAVQDYLSSEHHRRASRRRLR